ncbi:hypothetical protein A2791_02150 [Candidatus Saccharibacteria bacterium RIFCSPHIGHO2_01_FULL_46_30]|nr:MAG: hypothetical protein A2791_02150 [Candidatus Saccharibacteria bacterium RIFCSPHIGHO2_01_FULL_46_30]
MNHLVIAVSADSSLELLGKYADVIILDKDPMPTKLKYYESVYIRSHFSTPELSPQNYRSEIEDPISRAVAENENVKFIDHMDTIDAIIEFEDKWHQYQKFSEFMPPTKLLSDNNSPANFTRPVYKKRLSSRGNGVTWNITGVSGDPTDWIIQETLNIAEEIRVYTIDGKVHSVGAIRRSMSNEQKTLALNHRELVENEIQFASKVAAKTPSLDILGLDIARTENGELFLMEVNRSPGFGAFEKLTGVNLADFLYK